LFVDESVVTGVLAYEDDDEFEDEDDMILLDK
jgi:hypothetical protein